MTESQVDSNSEVDAQQLSAVSRLLGLLLLRELDEPTIRSLSTPDLEVCLADLGLDMPAADSLEELGAAYFDSFINPQKGTPLVQSLHEGGSYEGEAARGVRAVAEAASLQLEGEHLRGAPIDHLAVELFLWSELVERDTAAAAEFARRHLAWAGPILRRERSCYYSKVCHVVADFLEVVLRS